MRLLSEEIAAFRKGREGSRDLSTFVSGLAGKVEFAFQTSPLLLDIQKRGLFLPG